MRALSDFTKISLRSRCDFAESLNRRSSQNIAEPGNGYGVKENGVTLISPGGLVVLTKVHFK